MKNKPTIRDVAVAAIEVAEERPDHKYREKADPQTLCSYLYDANNKVGPGTGCLVGQALRRVGFGFQDLLSVEGATAAGALERLFLPGEVDEADLLVHALTDAQAMQDQGAAWGEAIGPVRKALRQYDNGELD